MPERAWGSNSRRGGSTFSTHPELFFGEPRASCTQYHEQQDVGSVALSPCSQNCAFPATPQYPKQCVVPPVKYWNKEWFTPPKKKIKPTQGAPCKLDSVTHLHFSVFTPEWHAGGAGKLAGLGCTRVFMQRVGKTTICLSSTGLGLFPFRGTIPAALRPH